MIDCDDPRVLEVVEAAWYGGSLLLGLAPPGQPRPVRRLHLGAGSPWFRRLLPAPAHTGAAEGPERDRWLDGHETLRGRQPTGDADFLGRRVIVSRARREPLAMSALPWPGPLSAGWYRSTGGDLLLALGLCRASVSCSSGFLTHWHIVAPVRGQLLLSATGAEVVAGGVSLGLGSDSAAIGETVVAAVLRGLQPALEVEPRVPDPYILKEARW